MPSDENDDSIRASLSAAMDSAEAAGTEGASATQPAAQDSTKSMGTAPTIPTVQPSTDGKDGGAEPTSARARAPDGTFAAKSVAADAVSAPVEPAPLAEVFAAPASWKPAVREQWSKLPREVQEEVRRREVETARVLNESTETRRFAQAFQDTIRPFESIIAAEAPNPLAAVRGLMQTVAGLRTGSPMQRAQIVANIVRTYGVDVNELDGQLAAALSGAPQQQQPQQQYNDPRIDQLTQFMQSVQGSVQQRQQQAAQAAQTEMERFAADPANDFFNDVREDMADIMDFSAKRGRTMSLQQAYDQAVQFSPELKPLADQRAAVKLAAQPNMALAAKKAASSSVAGPTGGGNNRAEPTSIRESILAAMDSAGQG